MITFDSALERLASFEKNDLPESGSDSFQQAVSRYDLLSPEDEKSLFMEMNFLKFNANRIRSHINLADIQANQLALIEEKLDRAQMIKTILVEANMRLVLSIVKKFTGSRGVLYDDLLSEGSMILLKCIEQFDYTKGFRFSTYAFRSITRSMYHVIQSRVKHESKMIREVDWSYHKEERRNVSVLFDQAFSNMREVAQNLLDLLSEREIYIIQRRYALGSHRKAMSYQEIANSLGLSKERVRQIEKKAIKRLQVFAQDVDQDELFGAYLA